LSEYGSHLMELGSACLLSSYAPLKTCLPATTFRCLRIMVNFPFDLFLGAVAEGYCLVHLSGSNFVLISETAED